MATDPMVAELTELRAKLDIAERRNEELADMAAGAGLALWEAEQDLARMRLAWQSARQRAAAYGEGILRVVSDREAWEKWTKQAEEKVAELQSLIAERDEQIAGLLHSEITDDEPAGVPW